MLSRFFIVLYILSALWVVLVFVVESWNHMVPLVIISAIPVLLVLALHFIVGFRRR